MNNTATTHAGNRMNHMEGLMHVMAKLKESAPLEAKIEVTDKLCDEFNLGIFNPEETKIAAEILSILSHDLEIKIRKIISYKLKSSPLMPRELALRLASDVLEVSLPILEFSFVLSDEDLIEIIRSTKEAAKQQAIAKRKPLSYRLVDELINVKDKLVVKTVINNREAYISSRSAEKILEDFKHEDDVLQALIDRGNLSLTLAERMVAMVSGKLREQLLNDYRISPETAASLVEEAHDEIILTSAQQKKVNEINDLVKHLHERRKLNYNLVLRALCKGDLEFFESGLAYLTNIPKSNVQKLIHDKSFHGFRALYKAANFPENLYEATQLLLQFVIQEQEEFKNPIDADYSHRIIHRIITAGYDRTVVNMRYLLALVGSGTTSGLKSATVH